jgi:carbamoyltransferase
MGPPDLAIGELLTVLGAKDRDISSIAIVRDDDAPDWWARETTHVRTHGFRIEEPGPAISTVEPHEAHAKYAFGASGFESAVCLVCDTSVADGYSAFVCEKSGAKRLAPVGSFPLAQIYGEMTEALGLQSAHEEHLAEAMARAGDGDAVWLPDLIAINADGVTRPADLRQRVADAAATSDKEAGRRNAAAAVQRRLGECLVELLQRLARASGMTRVCLSGGFFFNTHFTTTASRSATFAETYVPPHPGRSGSALGAVLTAGERVPAEVGSPSLGPG